MSARYLAALRGHLGRRAVGNGDRAQALGRAALAGGVVTLDLATMHWRAMITLAPTHDFAETRNGSLKRAGLFFTQALAPLEAAHRATRETNRQLHERNETLRRHAAALLTGNRRLEREIVRRKAGEVVIRKGQKIIAHSFWNRR
jgi:hypothetical protein